MIIAKDQADAFISGYTHIMATIHGPKTATKAMSVTEVVAVGRAKYLANRGLLDEALQALGTQLITIPPEVVSAVRGIEVKRWVYLKDAKTHSIFIDPDGAAAYAVFGLTQGMREVLGRSGVAIETGLMRYHGRYVTDSIVTSVLWLGPGYRKSFAELFAEIKARGAFRKTCAS
jgi:hypothetical protein